MKKLTIGRGRDCNIRIEDSTDSVSRRQAVITVSLTGKMMLYDTSSNGTYVNGVKVEKPGGVVVRRGDKINFAHVADLDWNTVKDPYRSVKIVYFSVAAVLLVGAILCFSLMFRTGSDEVKADPAPGIGITDTVPDRQDDSITSFNMADPQITAPSTKPQKVKSKKRDGSETPVPDKKRKLDVEPMMTKPEHEHEKERTDRIDEAINTQR